MLRVYFDQPTDSIKWHFHPDCFWFQIPDKRQVRLIKISSSTISEELGKFSRNEYRFAAATEFNSLWLEVDFGDRSFELAVVRYVRRLLIKHYPRFARAKVSKHEACHAPRATGRARH